MNRDWISVKSELPEEFDLVKILFKNERCERAWWTGNRWDGRREINDDDVIAWKRVHGYIR